jgi:uncharacterized membrane protein YjgN (DUF898 family)
MSWYYKDGDQEIGPLSKAELRELLEAKKIGAQTPVRSEHNLHWRPLVEFVRGKPADTPPPLHQEGTAREERPGVEKLPPPPPPPGQQDSEPGIPVPDLEKNIAFRFTGTGGQYFKIWIVNILLSVLTLGIYSAWAKVRRKQYFYGNTHLSDASFQYLADPVKILKGRLIVFLFFIAYSASNQFFPIISLAFIVVLLVFLPWLVVRSLAFNAHNSALRNIRFNFSGTVMDAAKAFVFWPLLMPFTLGLIGPYVYYRQKKFVVENCGYGKTQFHFKAAARDYYLIFLKFILPLILFIALAVIVGFLFAPLSILVIAVLYLYAFAYFTVRSSNLLYNSAGLSSHGFCATMAIKQYALIVFTNTLATVLTLGVFHPFAQVRAYRYKIEQLALLPSGDLDRFIAEEQEQVSAFGDEMSDFMDFDFGL